MTMTYLVELALSIIGFGSAGLGVNYLLNRNRGDRR
jgi:hypothetical protein